MHQHPQAAATTAGDFILTLQIATIELQRLWQVLIPLHDLVVEEANLILLGVLSAHVCDVMVPDLGRNLIVLGDMFEIRIFIVLKVLLAIHTGTNV